MKYVHRSCLDQWRTDGFDPKTVTHCGTCKVLFRLEQREASALGAEGEIWMQIARYLAWRLGAFLLIVVLLGFLPRCLFGAEQTRLCANMVLNHLTLGTASTFALTGGYAVLQVMWSINILNLRLDRWGTGGSKDSCTGLLLLLIFIGACVLLYHLVKGIWEIATVGGNVATANMRHANQSMRREVVRRYRVMNFDPSEPPIPCRRAAYADPAPTASGWAPSSNDPGLFQEPAAHSWPPRPDASSI